MEDWQTRVVEEKAELDKKRAKLSDFLNRAKLDKPTYQLLVRQSEVMEEYSEILAERIESFGTE